MKLTYKPVKKKIAGEVRPTIDDPRQSPVHYFVRMAVERQVWNIVWLPIFDDLFYKEMFQNVSDRNPWELPQ